MESILQAIFDKACAGVIAQRGQSMMIGDNSTCAYRGEGGKKCAIGHLLSDEQIEMYGVKEMDNPERFVSELVNELVPGVQTSMAVEFLTDLQDAHDNSHGGGFVSDFKYRANLVAQKWNLKDIK
jgi:hypothetical protein